MFKSKSYKDYGIFDFSDDVYELTEEQLIEVNGGDCGGGSANLGENKFEDNDSHSSGESESTSTVTTTIVEDEGGTTVNENGSSHSSGNFSPSIPGDVKEKKEEETVYNSTNLINQNDFDKRYGYNLDNSGTVTCKTCTLINYYANKIDIKLSQLDQVVKEWKENGYIAKDGSPNDLNKMSNSLAKNLGLKKHKSFIYPETAPYGLKMSEEDFNKSNYDFGIAQNYKVVNVGTKNEKVYIHYTGISKENNTTRILDSLDPNRPGVNDYTIKIVEPMEDYSVQ
ncbi:MAG: hypothetical protein K6E97_11425 [Treponema sp.]|nr:hypothetical protein [Treponema sp.]MCR5437661.1 hypothetical protein [Treponema sp.]